MGTSTDTVAQPAATKKASASAPSGGEGRVPGNYAYGIIIAGHDQSEHPDGEQ